MRLAERVAALARAALEEEPAVWPRLGLVGPDDDGGHRDMSYAHFRASAAAIEPTFAELARLGLAPGLPPALRLELARRLGVEAEVAMLAATGGRNTHRGAIFLLGVVVLSWAALARRRGPAPVEAILRAGAAAFAPQVARELGRRRSGGDESYGAWALRRHGAPGIRGLVLGGFAPVVAAWRHVHALERAGIQPALALGSGRLLAAALSDDTNLLKRAGWPLRERLRGELHGLWLRGGPLDPRNRGELARLDAQMARRGLSAAASGDLVAVVLLLRKLRDEGLALA